MFNSKMITHDVYAATITKNDFNEEIATLTKVSSIPMFIALNGANQYKSNDISVLQCAYIAIAQNGKVVKGNIIDNQYEVEYVVAGAHEDYVYMKERSNDGRINI